MILDVVYLTFSLIIKLFSVVFKNDDLASNACVALSKRYLDIDSPKKVSK